MPGLWVRSSLLLTAFVALGLTSLVAQSSSSLVRTNPTQQYEIVRATMEQFYRQGLLHSNIERQSGTYDLWNCTDPAGFMGSDNEGAPGDSALFKLVDLAQTTTVWRKDLNQLGVPKEVWEPLVSSYENLALQQAGELKGAQDEAARNQLAATLNKYRQTSSPGLPRFIVEGGCGAGEIEVRIALQPPDGQIFLIPAFLYKLCQAQHLDPTNPRSCDRWTEVIHGAASYVSGDYVYLARWTDGSVRCGPLGFKSFDQEGKTFQITKLRSPECNPGW